MALLKYTKAERAELAELWNDPLGSEKWTAAEKLAALLSRLRRWPLQYVSFAFPFSTERTIQIVPLEPEYAERFGHTFGPDKWAFELLDGIGREIRMRGYDGKEGVEPLRCAVASGRGVGKSTLVAWLVKFVLDTRPFSKGTVTAGTEQQLKTKTWAECGKWQKLSVTAHLYDYTDGRGTMSLIRKDHRSTWRVDAQTCKEENFEAFSGQHAAGSTSAFFYDEASIVPDKIFETAEAGQVGDEPMSFAFGNPVRGIGWFRELLIGRRRDENIIRLHVDSRTCHRVNRATLDAEVSRCGIDSAHVRSMILGLFPLQSEEMAFPAEAREIAEKRPIPYLRGMPSIVIGVDPSGLSGRGDETVVFTRVGMDARSVPPIRTRGKDAREIANMVQQLVSRFYFGYRSGDGKVEFPPCHVARIIVDAGGLGEGTYAALKYAPGPAGSQLPVMGVFASETPKLSAANQAMYADRATEIASELVKALQNGLCLPDRTSDWGRDLDDQLMSRTMAYSDRGKLKLEPKSKMRDRGVGSPDLVDALALTFSMGWGNDPIADPIGQQTARFAISEYDPLTEADAARLNRESAAYNAALEELSTRRYGG